MSQQTSKDDGEFERPAVRAGAREHDINATARAMSRENVELVRGYWEVVGDMGAFDPIHPEAEWKPVLTSNAALAGSVTCFSLLVSDPGQSGRERSGGGLRPPGLLRAPVASSAPDRQQRSR